MRPAIATVATALPWERNLVEAARATGLARVTARCWDPDHLRTAAHHADAVFIGSETPWLSADGIAALSELTTVIGVVAGRSDPMISVFRRGGAVEILDSSSSPIAALTAAITIARTTAPTNGAITVSVTGPRGAPGRTEVALSLAWHLGTQSLLAELDDGAPSLGLRCGLPPIRTLPDPATGNGMFPRFGELSLLLAPPHQRSLSTSIAARILDAARAHHRHVVLDVGPGVEHPADRAIVVCDPSPVGLVRCARLLDGWMTATPILVVNRAHPDTDLTVIRRATGLEPAAVLPEVPRPAPGIPPHADHLAAIAAVAHMVSRSPRSAA